MPIFRLKSLVAAAALALAGGAAQAATVAAVDLVNQPSLTVSARQVVGYRFAALSDLVVSGLGAFDFGGDGIQGGADVGLYALDGSLLAQARIAEGAGVGTLMGAFRFVGIDPVRLIAGTEYVIGSYATGPDTFFNSNYGAVGGGRVDLDVDPRIQLLRNRDTTIVDGLVFPFREPPNSHLGSFGPNLLIDDAPAAVPVPAALPLLALALAATALVGRRRA